MVKMTDENLELKMLHDRSSYWIDDLDSEIQADRLCSELLKKFHRHLLRERGLEPLAAGSQAAGADYFLREFMIGKCRENIFATSAERVRQFAGNWYIVSNLEPNLAELAAMLEGIASFAQYCAAYQLIEPETAEKIVATCRQKDYFQQRIDAFHNISGAGFSAWEQACPL